MIKLKKFDDITTYMFPNGEIATPEKIRQKFPAVDQFIHVLEINGDVCQAVMNLKALRNIHKIDESLTEDEAIIEIENIINNPPESVASPEERQAASEEFSNILAMPDITANIDTLADDTIVKRNVRKGLWSASHLDILVKKGIISQAHANAIKSEFIK